jgi:catechol 2,3-dioxygenase-like lactoylglutathione lyase family enzyme
MEAPVKLNHLDLQVPDVVDTAAWFARHFDFTIVSNPTSPAIIILRGDDGFSLVLQRRRDDDPAYPEGFHIGFLVDDVATVRATRARLAAAGAAPGDVTTSNRGTMFYLYAPGKILVEVSCRPARLSPSAT